MKREIAIVYLLIASFALAGSVMAEPLLLKASKDGTCRSNDRTRNNGACDTLYIAHASNIRAIMEFDLSNVTNRIIGAELRFREQNDMSDPITLTVAPMVQTKSNAAWGEGSGNLAFQGQNARPGESCYGWSAFPDVQWDVAEGKAARDLGDAQLWQKPIGTQRIPWKSGDWAGFKITDVGMLEAIRTSAMPTITFGVWGTAGNGLYAIDSRESGNAPELVLTLAEKHQGLK